MALGEQILLLGIVAVLGLAIVALFYIDRKYPKQEKKWDPALKAIFITAFLLFIVYLGVFMGVFDKQWVQDHYWIFLVMFIGIYLFYYIQATSRRPAPPDVLYAEASKWVDYFFQGEEIVKDGEYFKVENIGSYQDNNVEEGKLGNFYTTLLFHRKVKGGSIYDFYVTMDRYTKDITKMIKKPSVHLKHKLMHDEPKAAPDYYKESLNVEKDEE